MKCNCYDDASKIAELLEADMLNQRNERIRNQEEFRQRIETEFDNGIQWILTEVFILARIDFDSDEKTFDYVLREGGNISSDIEAYIEDNRNRILELSSEWEMQTLSKSAGIQPVRVKSIRARMKMASDMIKKKKKLWKISIPTDTEMNEFTIVKIFDVHLERNTHVENDIS